MPKRILIGVAAMFAVIACSLAAMLAFGGPANPPVQLQLAGADVRIGDGLADIPPIETYRARDGADLAYRRYHGARGDGVAVVVHGSSGSGVAVHRLAKALSFAGVTVFAIDVRGHGRSGPRGDIAYVGQLDDDLADFAARIDGAAPQERRLLIGHSSGGGFVLRIAGGPLACEFDGFIALSPYLNYRSPTNRPKAGWAGSGTLRIIALSILNSLGVSVFDGLPAVKFAIPPNAPGRTSSYSWRLLRNFGLSLADWESPIRAIMAPTRVIAGASDELFYADQYPPTFVRLRPEIGVSIVPGVDHMGMVLDPAALAETVRAAQTMLAAPAQRRCK